MTATMSEVESLSLKVNQEIRVRASLGDDVRGTVGRAGPRQRDAGWNVDENED